MYHIIPLDIFRKNLHNKGINTDLDAWLMFLTTDEPEMILKLIKAFPAFKEMYQDIYELCRNIEGVMNMFSKELQELDRNTVQYMIDEMQNEINEQKQLLEESGKQLEKKDAQLEEKDAQLEEKDAQLEKANNILNLQSQHMRLTNKLYALLLSDNRQDDLNRALTDDAFCEQLFQEYHLS